jgi:hypothetical protein
MFIATSARQKTSLLQERNLALLWSFEIIKRLQGYKHIAPLGQSGKQYVLMSN